MNTLTEQELHTRINLAFEDEITSDEIKLLQQRFPKLQFTVDTEGNIIFGTGKLMFKTDAGLAYVSHVGDTEDEDLTGLLFGNDNFKSLVLFDHIAETSELISVCDLRSGDVIVLRGQILNVTDIFIDYAKFAQIMLIPEVARLREFLIGSSGFLGNEEDLTRMRPLAYAYTIDAFVSALVEVYGPDQLNLRTLNILTKKCKAVPDEDILLDLCLEFKELDAVEWFPGAIKLLRIHQQ